MKTGLKIIGLLLVILVVIQFIRPNKNLQQAPTKNDFLIYEKAPKTIAHAYTKACYDCHSNYTHYKWFDHIAPISWYVDSNIESGNYNLNFSNWRLMSPLQKEIMFQAILFNIDSGNMPKKNYLNWHPEAQLTEEEKIKMIDWLVSVKKKFLESKEYKQDMKH